jgi:mono/diheme cytochrome c family protein
MRHILSASLVLTVLLLPSGCGGGSPEPQASTAPPTGGDLSAAELEHGIGPISAFTLDAVDQALATTGEEVFTVKCSACHKMGERYVGPALGDVTTRRSPAYIMNMILNPEGMVQRHPEARKLLAEFMTPMANQNLTQEEARAVLEFLRTQVPQ